MGLGNCAHCWDNPCTCGDNYNLWTEARLQEQIDMLRKVLERKKSERESKEAEKVSNLQIVTEPYSN